LNIRILLLALGSFVIGTETFMIAGLLPEMADAFHVSVSTAGQLVTVYSLVYAIGSPVLMTLTGRAERRRLLVGSLLLFAAGNVVCGLGLSYGVTLAGRIIAAAAAGLFAPAAAAAAAALAEPDKRGRALSAVIGGQTVSLILGVPAGTYLAFASDWTMPFWAVAAGSLLAAALVRGRFPVIPSTGAVTLKERLAYLGRPAILSALFTTLLWGIAIFSVYTYIADLYAGFGAEGEAISLVLLVGGIASFAGVILGGYAADRIGPAGTIALALTVLTVSLASMSLLYASPGFKGLWGTALAAGALYGISSYAFNPAQQHRLIGLSGPSAGIVLSLNASAIYLGSAGGAFLGGLVLKYGSAAMLGYFGGACALAALTLFGLGRLSGAGVRSGQPADG
jgi:predicted MFS family arabinose efflux permease